MWTPDPSGAVDRRWPNVDKLLDRQPWDRVKEIVRGHQPKNAGATMAALRRFTELLVQWNRSVSNLISKNDEERIVLAHLIPSIELAGWLKSRNLSRWCDLGSGGGFPALPLVICGVGEAWDLVESRRTKTLFLQRAVQDLGLANVRVLVARIEDLVTDASAEAATRAEARADDELTEWKAEAEAGRADHPVEDSNAGTEASAAAEGTEDWKVEAEDGDEWGAELTEAEDHEPRPRLRVPFDGFTSRATLALAPTLECSAPIVRPGGEAFLWKGSRLGEELAVESPWRASWEAGEIRSLSAEHSVVANFLRK